jgi:phosphoesterase RecJ-like protein
MKKEKFTTIKKLIRQKSNFVIVTHWSPDGDAMGSSLGLYHFLKALKKKVKVIVPNDYPDFLKWLPGSKDVIIHENNSSLAEKFILKSELVFTLDFNHLGRIEALGNFIAKTGVDCFMIDHHQLPDNYAKYFFHDVKSCSTAQLVYEFIKGCTGIKVIDKKIATCLYTGIMTDTGSFRFPSTTSDTHKIVAELIAKGANNSAIYNAVYDEYTADRMKLLGYCLNKMVILESYQAAYIDLSEEEQKKYNFKKGDTEGVVNYALSIKGIKLSAFFAHRDGMIKISFRSKGNFDVNLFSRNHFSGGGHKNAAGGKSHETLSITVKRFVDVLAQYKKELNA